MKKKLLIIALVLVVIAILFIPIPTTTDEDISIYSALTYKIVSASYDEDDTNVETEVLIFPRNLTLDESIINDYEERIAQAKEEETVDFTATITKILDGIVTVEPTDDYKAIVGRDEVTFNYEYINNLNAEVGYELEITCDKSELDSGSKYIELEDCDLSNDLRHLEFTQEWLDKENARSGHPYLGDLRIDRIYANCFFASPVIPSPETVKLNGKLSDEWCVGDVFTCDFENDYYDKARNRVEADFKNMKVSDFELDEDVCYKPVIYLYPESETEISVNLTLNGKFSCTYPEYNNGWKVTASPDGTLKDKDGQTYNYLYWEGEMYADYDLSKGFCVKGETTLEKLGLNRKEANEFIVYWLPLMKDNPYNIIAFQTDCYTDNAKLDINPAPDTLIRVFMTWKPSDSFVQIPAQKFSNISRIGYTAVEWGGTQLK